MATIRPRKRRDGSTAYLAEVRIKHHGRLVHRESRTFDESDNLAKQTFFPLVANACREARSAKF